jgi:signal transduction histidine kinase
MRPDGSGLGLYIVRNIALRHGGDVTVVSEEGKGTTFSFTVPKAQLDFETVQPSVATFFAGF